MGGWDGVVGARRTRWVVGRLRMRMGAGGIRVWEVGIEWIDA